MNQQIREMKQFLEELPAKKMRLLDTEAKRTHWAEAQIECKKDSEERARDRENADEYYDITPLCQMHDCDSGGLYGTTLAASSKHNILLMGYQYSQRSYQLPSEKGDRLTGFRTTDGKRLWDTTECYISRPIINGSTIYAQPYSFDLLTGVRNTDFELKDRQPGGCGPMAGSTNLLLYRSGTLGYTDLTSGSATQNYGPVRPGCWINAIVAGGLVLMPDATDRCTCSYLMKASIALTPAD